MKRRYPYMALAAWKAKASAGDATSDVVLHKGVTLDDIRTLKEAGEENTLRVVISTSGVDRSRDVIDQVGWDLSAFNGNPVVLFAHDYWSPSIAKAPRTYPEAGQLVSYPEFCPLDLYPFGNMIGRMVRGGYLNAASVGFRPLEWTMNDERGGVDFKRQELMEWSVVPVPDNPEALVGAKSAGIDLEPLKAYLEQALDGLHVAGLTVSKDILERAQKLVGGDPLSVVVTSLRANDGEFKAAVLAALEGEAPVEKIGRVISRANETKLRNAHAAIGEVLSQVEEQVEEDSGDGKAAAVAAAASQGSGGQGAPAVEKAAAPAIPAAPAAEVVTLSDGVDLVGLLGTALKELLAERHNHLAGRLPD